MFNIERFEGSRNLLRPFFEMADDSPAEIDRYIEAGEIFVARREGKIVGHVQVIRRGRKCEIKSISVVERRRREGVGSALVRFVLNRAMSGCTEAIVGTATIDTGAVVFYLRLGFRLERIERDVFTAERGYAAATPNAVSARDRVWLSTEIRRGRRRIPSSPKLDL